MTTTQRAIVPRPLNPRDTNALTRHLLAGECVRITTTNRPRTILTVREIHPSTSHAPQLVLTTPPSTTAQHTTYHCTAIQSDAPMTVIEYTHTPSDMTARCIGSLTTIAYLPRFSTPRDNNALRKEVRANEYHHCFRSIH